MTLRKNVLFFAIFLVLAASRMICPDFASAQSFKTFYSEEYDFTMKFPADWVKVEPKGNYYIVFQAPDLIDNFRSRINVSAHKPVKDPLNVLLQEFRTGVAELQKKGPKETQEVKIVDEGEFKSEIPGSYYFFIQALDSKLKVWMDIVVVYYKWDQTLVRVSCLAPSGAMERLQPMFNEVLVSLRVGQGQTSSGAKPQSAPAITEKPAAPSVQSPAVGQSQTRPAPAPSVPAPSTRPAPTTSPAPSAPAVPTDAEGEADEDIQTQTSGRQIQPAPAPKPGPRGPAREPERPATGIVN